MNGTQNTLCAQVDRYVGGELAAEDEQAVLDHLADCKICQGGLGDVVGRLVGAAPIRGPVRGSARLQRPVDAGAVRWPRTRIRRGRAPARPFAVWPRRACRPD